MAGQLTIFTPMIEALTREITALIERKRKLEDQNRAFNAEINSNKACLENADWYDKKEIENDILNTEREVRSNDETIANIEKEIAVKQKQRADYIDAMEGMNGKQR
jgi:hypothetical protein